MIFGVSDIVAGPVALRTMDIWKHAADYRSRHGQWRSLWEDQPQFDGQSMFLRPSVFPFALYSTRPFTPDEGLEFTDFCRETFGLGGWITHNENRWISSHRFALFGFKNETDKMVFKMAFSDR